MKKKVTLIVTCVALVAAIVVGGTLAFFTDNDKVENVVTFGNVSISLKEPNFEPKENENIFPGKEITKDPTITNEGSNPCWVRAKIEVFLNDQSTGLQPEFNIKPGWTTTPDADGYYYYNTALSKDATAILFDTVTIPAAWDND